jgi:hypothetical protein
VLILDEAFASSVASTKCTHVADVRWLIAVSGVVFLIVAIYNKDQINYMLVKNRSVVTCMFPPYVVLLRIMVMRYNG